MQKGVTVYKGHKLSRQIDITQIYTIFCNEMSNNYSSYGEHHDFWEYIYICEGNLLIDSDNNFFELEKGDFFLHKPNEYHRHFVTNAKASIYITSFDCESEMLYKIANKKIKTNPFAKATIAESMNIADKIFSEISEDLTDERRPFIFIKYPDYNISYEQILRNTIENIILSIICQASETIPIQTSIHVNVHEEKSVSSIIIEYMLKHIYTNISIDEICKIVHLGKTTVSTKFKIETGKSIIDYYNNLKISKAIDLLSKTNMNINEISITLNFSTSQYFSRLFKKYAGVFPSTYKKSLSRKKIGKVVYK